ncbi:MAG: response regulator transcription factor [Evtepia sp.]|uniref:response regulator transcription factor n=1 Tax=Evtepia sp. TaxID=2773933 RepID=UPI002A760D49|nr:response regulator transcription factor [Evtepia sp.]MDY3015228.1 response regulator transcription factor [Evtepia sp.]
MYRIFLVEDDPVIAGTIAAKLKSWGFAVQCAEDFAHVMEEFAAFQPHLVVMDVVLPFFNGYHWCQRIRQVSKVPILFLSSAGESVNIVMAINMGADDFIPKPFDLSVLLAKVQAALRRAYDYQGQSHLMEHRGALFNCLDCTITFEGEKAELTKNENRMLQVLMESKPNVVTRDALMAALWECDAYVDENALYVNMTRLRKKLESIGLHGFIGTKKGLGYMVK